MLVPERHLDGISVALRKESVDRNIYVSHELPFDRWSLSARRAWIEIILLTMCVFCSMVALRKESVDRNNQINTKNSFLSVALRKESVDRNNICEYHTTKNTVALRKESVDRNSYVGVMGAAIARRSPQGERG